MYRAIAQNKRNTVIILAVFILLIGGIGVLWGAIAGSWTISIVVVAVAIGYAILQYFFAAGQTMALAGGREITKADDPRFYRIVENLAITDGIPMPKVYIIDDPAPNAFATGRDPQHAVVAATSGILQLMDDRELEGVMAHEMGHVKNYDIRVSLVVFGLVVAIGLLADVALRIMFFTGGRNRSDSNGGGPAALVLLVIGLVAAIVAPLVAAFVQAAVSRQREYLADATGALTTRDPEGLASALTKLETYGRPVARTNTAMSHLWINDPNKPGMMSRLFSTHPPLPERIERLLTNATKF